MPAATVGAGGRAAGGEQGSDRLTQAGAFEHQVTGVTVAEDRWTGDSPVSVAAATQHEVPRWHPHDAWDARRRPRRYSAAVGAATAAANL